MRSKVLGALAALGIATVGLTSIVAAPAPAQAVSTDVAAAKGRAVGSDKWGYIGQFGKLNKTTQPGAGEFFLPYGIDVDGTKIAVTDSGLAANETGTKVPGHALQTFTRTAVPGSAGHGDYLGNGQYDIVNTKSTIADPKGIASPEALVYYPTDQARGPRGVAFGPDGRVSGSSYELPAGAAPATSPFMRQYASSALGATTRTFGPAGGGVPGEIPGALGVDTDAEGNVYVGTISGVSVFDQNGTFITAISGYFDQNGENQPARVQWATRMVDVPREYGKPDLMGETYGLSVKQEGGQTVVYVGDTGGYYQPDYKVHFQNGDTTAKNLKPASIKKYILTKSGGPASARWNPAGWKWTLDTSFGNQGAVQFSDNTLSVFFGRLIFSGQTVFGLEADPNSNTLFYSLNGASGVKIGAIDASTGAALPAPTALNGPSSQQDSYMSLVRGLAVDDRGLLYAATQNSNNTSTARSIVQIWGKTPTSIAGTGMATPGITSAEITWGESTVGHQQPDLLDYVVKYRKVGDTAWTMAAVPGGAAASTDIGRTITGLAPGTDYEAQITPFNEAGSGDPALITWRTETPAPAISVEKTGNAVHAPAEPDAVNVAAGAEVAFEYTITNTGNVPLSEVALTDSVLGATSLPADFTGTLEPKASVVAQAKGPVAAGAYRNVATVSGVDGDGAAVTAEDTWHGFGVTTGLAIEKTGNGKVAATEADAVHVTEGTEVTFRYTVKNEGNTAVSGVKLEDSVLGAVTTAVEPADFSGTIPAGGSVVFEAKGPIAKGAYTNTATVTGTAGGLDEAVTAEAVWFGHGDGKSAPVDPVDPVDPTGPTDPNDPTDPEKPVTVKPAPPKDGGLSETGGAPLLPLSIGGAVLVAGGVLLLLLRRRTRTQ
ncbi:fibronectin type III domain-containing protein [Leucobacter sp. CSA2]|uniref:Fibronectin type III domain-containing protein n=1 Tax=Leucobacter edaphi TaxID=2796472 RepID=A0A934QEW7_9MICO|nr:fibronectin type III domain-containing protein [Leucobacter edaphi]MBK0422127.1 fibronectin type III domain-containing protein [Leucobacter edaphi]